MKNFIKVLLLSTFIFCLCGCGNDYELNYNLIKQDSNFSDIYLERVD